MWLLLARAPLPDVPYWPGRRALAVLDAIGWPAVCVAVLMQVPVSGGIVVPVAVALAIAAGLQRLSTAVWRNHRYRFTTWRWGRVAGALLLLGWVLKWTVGR